MDGVLSGGSDVSMPEQNVNAMGEDSLPDFAKEKLEGKTDPDPPAAPPAETPVEPETPEPAEAAESVQYEPDYSYRVNKQEMVFDDRLKEAIKDKESEDYVRDLVTKAAGFDEYKTRLTDNQSRYDDLSSKYKEFEDENSKYKTGIDRLDHLAKNDLHSFQRAWNISDDQIVQLARDILVQQENPALAQQRQSAFDSHLQNWRNEDLNSQQSQEVQRSTQELHEMKMELAMSKPDVQEFETRINAVKGNGYFENKIREYGTLQYQAGNYIQPKDAVKFVMEEYGSFLERPGSIQQQTQPDQQSGSPQPKPPAQQLAGAPLPNLGTGRSGSPVAPSVSWKRLKELAGMST